MIQWLLANKKLLSYATGAITVAVSLYQLHGYVYDNGYRAATAAIQAEHNAALERQRKEYERKTQFALDTLSADHAAEVARLRAEVEIEYVTQTVVEYVTKTIEVPSGCEQLANDVVGVLDKATGIVISASNRSAEGSDKP